MTTQTVAAFSGWKGGNMTTKLDEMLDKLAAFEPVTLPVISLYLNAQANERGRDEFMPFVRKALSDKQKTYKPLSKERESFDRDVKRINNYLEDVRPSSEGVAIFACAGANDFFEAIELDAAIEENRLYIYHQPHLYPLARLRNQYSRYAILVADTNAARLFVVGFGRTIDKQTIQNVKVSRTSGGGWSQMRYQRHAENYHLHHAKEIIEVLEKTVRKENINRILLAGDEVIIPLLREQLTPFLVERVVDILRLDINTPEHEIMEVAADALREHNAVTDAERVGRLLDEYRAGGLAVVGVHDTLLALANGQVDEVLLSASLEEIYDDEIVGKTLSGDAPITARPGPGTRLVKVADEFVTQARQTGARVTFIEEVGLLKDMGGVGAMLRYKL